MPRPGRRPLPADRLYLAREEFQHRSSRDVANVQRKASALLHVIVTEHVPAAGNLRAKYLDKPYGPNIGPGDASDLFLESSSFSTPGVRVL